jgi:hypothetical protein
MFSLQKKIHHARGGGSGDEDHGSVPTGCVKGEGDDGTAPSCIAPPVLPAKKKLLLSRDSAALAMTFISGLFNKTSGKRLLPHLNVSIGSMLSGLLTRRNGTMKAPSLRGHGNMTSLQRQNRNNITPISNEKRMQGVLFARV